jgi:hypothetical protein
MRNQMRPSGDNPYDTVTKVVSGILAGIFTFFVFPFAFLSVHFVTAFSNSHYQWLPTGLITFFWGLALLVALFAGSMLSLILAINVGLKLMGRR